MKRFLMVIISCIYFFTSVSFAASAIPEAYRFYQSQSEWNQGDAAKYKIKDNGCGPTALATIFSSKIGKRITPVEIAQLPGFTDRTAMTTLLPSAQKYVKKKYPSDYAKVKVASNNISVTSPTKLNEIVSSRKDAILGHITNHFFAIDCANYISNSNPEKSKVGVVGYKGAYTMMTMYDIYNGAGFENKKMDYVRIIGDSSGSVEVKPKLFNDIDSGHWAYNDIDRMKNLGVVTGRDNGYFDPNASVTAEEFIAFVSRVTKLKNLPKAAGSSYLENYTQNRWSHNEYIHLTKVLGKISGEKAELGKKYITKVLANDGFWNEGQANVDMAAMGNYTKPITREKAAYLIASLGFEGTTSTKIMNVNDWDNVNPEFRKSINGLVALGIFNGVKNSNGTVSVNPKGYITRAEAIALVNRLYTALK